MPTCCFQRPKVTVPFDYFSRIYRPQATNSSRMPTWWKKPGVIWNENIQIPFAILNIFYEG